MKYSLLIITIITFFISTAQQPERTISNAHTSAIKCLAISFDASKALTGGADNRAYCWDLNSGSKLRSLAAQDDVITDVAYNNDQTLFATSSQNKTVVIWDANTFKPRKILKGHLAAVAAIAFHPFRDEMLSVGADGNIKLWDAQGGRVTKDTFIIFQKNNFTSARAKYAKDASCIGINAGGSFNLYKTDGALIKSFPASLTAAFDICGDSKTAAYLTATNNIEIINSKTGTVLQNLTEDFSNVTSIRFAQSSSKLCLSRSNGKVEIYDLDGKQVIYNVTAHTTGVVDAELSEDGKVLVTAGNDLAVKKWNVESLDLGYVQLPSMAAKGDLSVNRPTLREDNNNGMLEAGENASLSVTLVNPQQKFLYDIYLRISSDKQLQGLVYPQMFFAGQFPGKGNKTFSIPLKMSNDLGSGSANLTITAESGGVEIASQNATIQTGSKNNAGVAVQLFRFFSPSGKAAIGEPITLQLTIENITGVTAENIEVVYSFPQGINAIDKARETIPKLAPGERVNIAMQFMAQKGFTGDKLSVRPEINGVGYSNVKEMNISSPINATIGTRDEFLAMTNGTSRTLNKGSQTATEDYGSGEPIEKTRYVALMIGINSYTGTWPVLNNAVNDAKGVALELQKNYNFSLVRAVYDKEATRAKIIDELEWCVDNLGEKDNLVIFYSGHGEFKESLNKGFWVPVDALTGSTSQLISNADLHTFLASIRTKHTLLISDACFSGDITRGRPNYGETDNDKFYKKAHSLMSRQAITSGGIEPVMDGGKDGHSIFTYYLIKALRENKAKFIDASHMYESIKVPIVNNSDQSPKLSQLKNTGDEGGEFIFYRP
ncbi:MAG: caspase family protein [Bacteroidetes bacterium]|nr:caspase family protein [Bacteroidota bacterium]